MTGPRRQLALILPLRLIPPAAVLACLACIAAAPARAGACTGSDGQQCPYASASVIGPRAEGVLRFPEAVAVDAAGSVYVADSSHNRIEKFDPNGTFLVSWGGRGSGLGRLNFGSSQNPTQPPGGGIAATASYVYVADSGNHRIQRFNLQGQEAMQWGSY